LEDSDYIDLEVKPSQIPGAGLGLFTKRDFNKGEILTEYKGKVISSKYSYHKVFAYENKMIKINNQYCIIGNCIGSFANDLIIFDLSQYKT